MQLIFTLYFRDHINLFYPYQDLWTFISYFRRHNLGNRMLRVADTVVKKFVDEVKPKTPWDYKTMMQFGKIMRKKIPQSFWLTWDRGKSLGPLEVPKTECRFACFREIPDNWAQLAAGPLNLPCTVTCINFCKLESIKILQHEQNYNNPWETEKFQLVQNNVFAYERGTEYPGKDYQFMITDLIYDTGSHLLTQESTKRSICSGSASRKETQCHDTWVILSILPIRDEAINQNSCPEVSSNNVLFWWHP